MNAIVMAGDAGAIVEAVVSKGDLGKLTPTERVEYYRRVCDSVGLNPLTRPLEYLVLNGKTVLYARRDAADQLRKINGISIEIVSRAIEDGLLTVHVRAKDGTGRTDEDFGVVNLGNLKGEAAANAILKAVTKAKRRVTLSISGLGFLDETEVEDIPSAAKAPAPRDMTPRAPALPAPIPVEPPHDPTTGEVRPHAIPLPQDGNASSLLAWGSAFVAAINAASDAAELSAWERTNSAALLKIADLAPKVHTRILARLAVRKGEIAAPQPETAEVREMIATSPQRPLDDDLGDIPPFLDRRQHAEPEPVLGDAWEPEP